MADSHFDTSPWGDSISANNGSQFNGLDENIVNELANTFAASQIHSLQNDDDDTEEQITEDTEEQEETVVKEEISDTSNVLQTPVQDSTPEEHPKAEPKDTSELLSSLTKGSEDSILTQRAIASPKKDEALFKESTNPLHLPDTEEDPEDKDTTKSNLTSSPTKLRRQNIYKAPRLRRNPLKSGKKLEDSADLESGSNSDLLGPLGLEQDTAVEENSESAAERLLRQSETPLFQINRTPLSPLKAQSKQLQSSSSIQTTTKTIDEEQQLEQAQLEQKAKEKTEPAIKLNITVGDPIKVGDLTGAHIVYSVRTKTDSDLFRGPQTVVSRRYRDFRWLYRQLQATHPGRVIPPPPDKQAVGRFNEDFIEGRRLALERMLVKISENINLQKDEDFLMFLQSERFSSEAREREKVASVNSIFTDVENDAGLTNNSGGFLSSIGGAFSFTPKAVEPDDYFRDKRGYIESLDQQLKVFLRNLETVVVQRHDLAVVTEEFSNIITTLADLEISKNVTELFQEFSTTQLRVKELLDRLSLQDMLTLGSTLDEYQRVVSSIRTTFQQREKVLLLIATSQHDLKKKQASLDKNIKYSSTQTEKISSLKAEVASLEQKHASIQENFETISKTIKEELATFEVDKIHDFRNTIEIYLESTIESQKEAVELWETFYNNNLNVSTATVTTATANS